MTALAHLPAWRAAMNRQEALDYTSVSGKQLDEWIARGMVRFRARGPRGQLITPKSDLDAALLSLFGSNDDDSGEVEFD